MGLMIKSGGHFTYRENSCVIGAVVSIKGFPYIVTSAHVFHKEGDHVIVDGKKAIVTSILKDFDLALIELPHELEVEFTDFGSPLELEQALLVNEMHTIKCRVVTAGSSLLFLGFRCLDLPLPGDSGSPILQAGKVVGLISSVTLDTCIGIAISSNILRRLSE